MTCTVVLEQILDADLEALEGRGGSDVAVHVRGCPRCAAVARQLLADTRSLAVAAQPASMMRGRARERAGLLAPPAVRLAVGIAAAALIAVVWRGVGAGASAPPAPTLALGAAPIASASRATSVSSPATLPAPRAVNPMAAERQRSAATHRSREDIGRPFPPAARVVAARVEAAPVAVPVRLRAGLPSTPAGTYRAAPRGHAARGADVAVDPMPGTQAMVMRTADPAVTVVWLY